MRYEVSVGAFVTVLRRRKLTISAEDEDSAKEKAKELFREIGRRAGWEVDSIEIDYVKESIS